MNAWIDESLLKALIAIQKWRVHERWLLERDWKQEEVYVTFMEVTCALVLPFLAHNTDFNQPHHLHRV
jgi:hypothetical protein